MQHRGGKAGRKALQRSSNTGSQLRAQYTVQLDRGHAGAIETKWRSFVVGERCCQVICGVRILRGQPRLRPRLIYDS
jgi:hypothetical protein